MPALFNSYNLKSLTFRNRIAVSPMCQYSATDGVAQAWHQGHYTGLARGGASLVVIEATAVSPEGRISPECLGLWNDEQAAALAPIVASIKAAGAIPGIQIAHAGRKASANRPWAGDDHIPESDPRSWQPIAPSAVAFGANLPRVPREMTATDIRRVQADFVAAAQRARDLGIEFLMLHFAHGYLAQSFLSTWSNQRPDEYGGSVENRSRFHNQTVEAVRRVWPDRLPLCARLGVLEFDGKDEATLSDSIQVVKGLQQRGLDFLDVSMGFSTPSAQIPWGPAMMGPIARRVLKETGLPGATSWNISTPELAEELVGSGTVDMVMIGRQLLADPHWPYAAAKKLGVEKPSWVLPAPYAHWLERYRG
ncbi:MAG: NADH:flavin oxidoreductase/NADH oxidase [Verrucomicrobiales bacterium]|nr:NADH:flavin oxidoreductase/NADH oxidase [Verrucomicrobiales bacterium]